MDPQVESVPDDVWISIFELSSPADLARLLRTCRRFNTLASNPLLRELRWRRPDTLERNLEAWRGNPKYATLVSLPRKAVIEVNLDIYVYGGNSWSFMTPHKFLHDKLYAQLPNFGNLNELVLKDTTISPYTNSVLAALPNLRSLSIIDCHFIYLHTTFEANVQSTHSFLHNPNLHPFNFATLSLTSLRLHSVLFPKDAPRGFPDHNTPQHPLHMITIPSLRSLSLVWTAMRATIYDQRNWALPFVDDLKIIIPQFTREPLLMDALPGLVAQCSPNVRVVLEIQHHGFSDQEIKAIRIPLQNVWKYEGPLSFANFGPDGRKLSSLTHLVMNESTEFYALLGALEKLTNSMLALDVCIREWDIELLYAICQLFPRIQYVVVRYRRGVLPVGFFVTLGADILCRLPHLHTLKLLGEEFQPTVDRLKGVFKDPGHIFDESDDDDTGGRFSLDRFFNEDTGHVSNESDDDYEPDHILMKGDLKDYLGGWNRYCKSLRHVQVEKSRWWERKFEGDPWLRVG
ncbi:hypothetical protein CVT26_005285 [Gymnopilus dilepis]|uniref:F-box domain-containing protein n=1 Tax=Gymnopilus dilepis TaxID=231916 RepID=A0A409YSY1_9AGAR|nr:hypothetical protein CVT26_005285 [Gymnopilus dilepis]